MPELNNEWIRNNTIAYTLLIIATTSVISIILTALVFSGYQSSTRASEQTSIPRDSIFSPGDEFSLFFDGTPLGVGLKISNHGNIKEVGKLPAWVIVMPDHNIPETQVCTEITGTFSLAASVNNQKHDGHFEYKVLPGTTPAECRLIIKGETLVGEIGP